MQKDIHNNNEDDLKNIIRQKLENHQLAVDDSCWSEIESKLNKTKKKVIPFWFWLSGGSAVAVLCLLFTLQIINNDTNKIMKTASNFEKQLEKNNDAKITDNDADLIEKQLKSKNKIQLTTAKQSYIKMTIPSHIQSNDSSTTQINTDELFTNTIDDISSNQLLSENNNSYNLTQKARLQTSVNNNNLDESNLESENNISENKINIWTDPFDKKNDKSIAFTASIGASNGISSSNGDLLFSNIDMESAIVKAPTYLTSISTPADFTNRKYLPPLSFGLTANKEINSTFGIESGLTYTYLHTKFENTINNATLNLHYIGIPLNLITKLWNINKTSIYMATGGMIEKGLRSIYVQTQDYDFQTNTTRASTNIDGVQWSLNASFGAVYKFDKAIGIYFEPKFSYFFDNQQPISIRTDNPFVISVVAGLKFKI